MGARNLTKLVLQDIRHCSLQHADASAATSFAAFKARCVLADGIATTAGFHSNQPHAFVRQERMKQSDRIRTAADTGDERNRYFAGLFQDLGARFATNDALKFPDHERIRMRSKRTAEEIVSVVYIRHPIAQR